MSKSTKILIAIATLWPFLYMILFFVFVFSMFLWAPASGDESSGFMKVFIPIHFLTMLWIVGLTIFYIVDVFRNDRVDKDKKVLWVLVIFMGSIIGMPIYWYLYIWPEAPVNNSNGENQVAQS